MKEIFFEWVKRLLFWIDKKYEEEVKGMKPYIASMESTTPANIAVICGSRREPSRVRALMEYVGEVLESKNLQYENIDLGSIELPVFRSKDQNEWNEVAKETVKKYLDADIYFIGSPVYFLGISGALKNLIDHTPWQEFKKKKRVAGIVMSGRNRQHNLVIDSQLRPIFVYLGVEVANTSVFAVEPDFGGEGFDLENPEVKSRVEGMVQETIGLWERMARNDK